MTTKDEEEEKTKRVAKQPNTASNPNGIQCVSAKQKPIRWWDETLFVFLRSSTSCSNFLLCAFCYGFWNNFNELPMINNVTTTSIRWVFRFLNSVNLQKCDYIFHTIFFLVNQLIKQLKIDGLFVRYIRFNCYISNDIMEYFLWKMRAILNYSIFVRYFLNRHQSRF